MTGVPLAAGVLAAAALFFPASQAPPLAVPVPTPTAPAPPAQDAPTAPVVLPTARIAALPMPARRAELDAAAAKSDVAAIEAIRKATPSWEELTRLMDWEELQVVEGGSVLYGFNYLDDLWLAGGKIPDPTQAAQVKRYAGVMGLYLLQQIEIDGQRCADVSAFGHRMDQLTAGRGALWRYVLALPEVTRRDLAFEALRLEARTAKLRRDDPVLCSGGMADINEALKGDNRPLGSVSGQEHVPMTPHPAYVDPAQSAPKQEKTRAAMPMQLARLLKLPEAPAK